MTVIMKMQIGWIPLSLGGMRSAQGKTLAVMQVSDGSQSFNVVNHLRNLSSWMRLLTSPFYDQLVDAIEVLMRFTLLNRENRDCLLDRYSERKKSAA
jgi:arsenic resistance protein ArsH